MKIGVFDSGVGGQSVVNAINKALPLHDVIYREDKANVPYGTKTAEQLYALVLPILQNMASDGCEVIVIACNSVTTTLITRLRSAISVPLIGMEPMVKPAAAATKTGVIAVCATPATLKSDRYRFLKSEYAKGVKVIEPDCSNWALLIENKQINREHIEQQIESVLRQKADVIVLGCTHYHWIEQLVSEEVQGKAVVIQPEQSVIAQLKRVLAQLG